MTKIAIKNGKHTKFIDLNRLEGILAVNCPKDNKLIPITDCKNTNCSFFNYYVNIGDEIREVDCSHSKKELIIEN